jgi:hypothetical protein
LTFVKGVFENGSKKRGIKFAWEGQKGQNVLPMFNLLPKMKKPDLLKGPVSLSSGGRIIHCVHDPLGALNN